MNQSCVTQGAVIIWKRLPELEIQVNRFDVGHSESFGLHLLEPRPERQKRQAERLDLPEPLRTRVVADEGNLQRI